jgi:lipoate-protein ligase A
MGASGKLEVLPTRSDSAAANMAADFLLLRRYPEARRAHARFRAYGWHRPAFTFGYSQKIAWVRAQLPADAEGVELVRRPTGGGLVDHRDDWTYALVIPRGHELEKARAVDSYRAVHAALAAALVAVGQAAVLMERCEPAADFEAAGEGRDGELPGFAAAKGPTVCFTRPELYDVVDPATGAKIAGAAQKRSKEGLLFQGSIWRPAAAGVRDWEVLAETFVAGLAAALGAEAEANSWPEFAEGEHEALTEQYAAPEWTEAR